MYISILDEKNILLIEISATKCIYICICKFYDDIYKYRQL